EVAANGVGMLAAKPGEAEVVADFLVGRRREDQIAARPESVACERGDRHCARSHLPLHVQRAPTPDLRFAALIWAQLAREGWHRPLGWVGEDDVGVREKEKSRSIAAGNPRDEVRALPHLGDQLTRDSVRFEVVAQELRGSR